MATCVSTTRVLTPGIDHLHRGVISFFEKWQGHVSDEQLASAREVWSADASEFGDVARSADVVMTESGLQIMPPRGAVPTLIDLCSVELKPNTVYQLISGAPSIEAGWRLVVVTAEMGESASQMMMTDQQDIQRIDGVFRTFDAGRVKIAAGAAKKAASPLSVARLTIREVASLGPYN